jgi:tRNA A-37 threonylcarbamoyl transferase component Bud32
MKNEPNPELLKAAPSECTAAMTRVLQYTRCPPELYKRSGVWQRSTITIRNQMPGRVCTMNAHDFFQIYNLVIKFLWIHGETQKRAKRKLWRYLRDRSSGEVLTEVNMNFCDLVQQILPSVSCFKTHDIQVTAALGWGVRGMVLYGTMRQLSGVRTPVAVKFTIDVSDIEKEEKEILQMQRAAQLGLGVHLICYELYKMADNIGMTVLVMEYADATLKDYLVGNKPLPAGVSQEDIVQLVIQLIESMEAAKVMHNDFHSGNIAFVTQADGSLKPVIIDVPTMTELPCYAFIRGYDAYFLKLQGQYPRNDFGNRLTAELNKYLARLSKSDNSVTNQWYIHRLRIPRQARYSPDDPNKDDLLRQQNLNRSHLDFYGRVFPLPAECPEEP